MTPHLFGLTNTGRALKRGGTDRQCVYQKAVTWQHPDDGIYREGAVLINQDGKRFCNELVFPDRELALAEQPDGVAYLLLDEALVANTQNGPISYPRRPRLRMPMWQIIFA